MTQATFLSTLISVMVAAGVLGGVANYFLTRREDPKESSIAKSIVIGIVAAFLVPLFLNMISSNLTEAIRGSPSTPADLSKILVFSGFCLIAAISSKAFIQNLSKRVLENEKRIEQTEKRVEQTDKRVEETDKRVEVVNEVAKSAKEKASEADGLVQNNTEPDGTEISGSIPPTAIVSENERKILQELARGKVYRTRTSVANNIGLDKKTEVEPLVNELKEKGLVDARDLVDERGTKKKRWFITANGKAVVAPPQRHTTSSNHGSSTVPPQRQDDGVVRPSPASAK